MWGISILADLDLCGISFHAVVVFGLGKNILFKSVLGHCDPDYFLFLLSFFLQNDQYFMAVKKYKINKSQK